jgi:hypothetical protein
LLTTERCLPTYTVLALAVLARRRLSGVGHLRRLGAFFSLETETGEWDGELARGVL